MNFTQIDKIASIYGTPFYLFDGEKYLANICAFQKAFQSRYNNLIIGYSFKTNYVPALCKIAKGLGCYAEVVSEMEYNLAQRIGFEHVIFNGPIKKEDVLHTALKEKSIINLDSMYEVESVIQYKINHPSEDISIGLRLNIDLTDDNGVSKVQCGLRVGRFGFTRSLLEESVCKLRNHNIKIVSLHGHTSSSDRAVLNYRLIVSQMLSVCEQLQLDDLLYFDIGGGFFGAPAMGTDVRNKPKYIDYANCILDTCLTNDWFNKTKPAIVIEPGVSVVANVFSYFSKIFQTKDIAGQRFLTTDGTVFDVKPTLHSNNLPYLFHTRKICSNSYKANLVGSTCMEKDVILKDVNVPSCIGHGDYVQIDGIGAYTMSLTPIFINYLSPIVEIKDDKIFTVRRRQDLDDVLSLYKL